MNGMAVIKSCRVPFVGLLLLIALPSKSQSLSTSSKKAIELYKSADNAFVTNHFAQAIDLLNQALKKDKNFEEAHFRLGIIKRKMADINGSTGEFESGLKMVKDPKRQNAYRYELTENHLKIGEYEKSRDLAIAFLSVEKPSTPRADQVQLWKSQAEYGLAHQGEKLAYLPQPLSDTVNAFPMQYYPMLTADNRQLIFTRNNKHGNEDQEDIFISTRNVSGKWTKPVSISDNINSSLSEGTSAISADGRYLIFTVCGRKTYGSCDLFESKKTGDTWSVPVNLGPMVNSKEWDSQPSVSSDGQELYFVSSRKGGFGGYDIWYSRRDSIGHWTKAQNLGNAVNSKFDEISPFIHVNNRNLYFASNGYPGYGGLDVYVSEKVNENWSVPQNMGAPLNNYEDQYSFFVTADGRTAYYSKDESGKANTTKLYSTPLPEPVQVKYYSNLVKGKVTSRQSGKPLQSSITLFDIQKDKQASVVASDSVTGEYAITLAQGSEYALYTSCPGYLFNSLSFNYSEGEHREPLVVNIALDEIKADAKVVLNNIFFETDKYDLKEKSLTELERVVRFMHDNPGIKVEIGGHTDNAGAVAYNLQLSLKRAQSVATYLEQHGVSPTRIVQKGYGSQQPVKPNDSEENRQANRRIEFKIK